MLINDRYRLAVRASRDLREIRLYLQERNPEAAKNLMKKLFHAFEVIADHPYSGSIKEDLAGKEKRFWVVGRYYILYRITAEMPEILRILHTSRNVASLVD